MSGTKERVELLGEALQAMGVAMPAFDVRTGERQRIAERVERVLADFVRSVLDERDQRAAEALERAQMGRT